MRPYAHFEDPEGRCNPAFEPDFHPHQTPEDLERLSARRQEAAEERPHLTYVIVALDHVRDPDELSTGGLVDVFGGLLWEQEAAIDRKEVRAQGRAHGGAPE